MKPFHNYLLTCTLNSYIPVITKHPSYYHPNIISSAENQKGINAVQRSSIENQKGAIVIDFVQ